MAKLLDRFDIRISFFYALLSIMWILFSDTLVYLVVGHDPKLDASISIAKGIGFVALTTAGLYLVLSAELQKRNRIEQELQLERDISPIAIVVFDVQGAISYANVRAETILGKSRSAIIGKPFDESLWHVSDYEGKPLSHHALSRSQLIQTQHTVYGIQQAIEGADGNRVLLEINLAPIINPAHVTTGFIATFSDVTSAKTQEKRLRDNEHILKQAQAVAHLGSAIWYPKTRSLHASDELYRTYGVDPKTFENPLNTLIDTLVHPDDRVRIMEKIGALINGTHPEGIEYRIMHSDQSVHWVWLEFGEIILDEQGSPMQVSVIVQDITADKAAEKALQESEIRYRTLFEQASDAILIVEPDGYYVEANSAACKMLGYSRDEILQKKMLDLFVIPDDNPLRYQELNAGKTLINEREMIRKDGSRVTVEVSSKLRTDGTVQAIARDISERKEFEQELRLKSAALEAAANGIVITDTTGTIKWANPAFSALTGYSLGEARDHNPSDLVKSGFHSLIFYEDMWNMILSGRVWRGQLVNRRKDGSIYTEEQTITPVRNEVGDITHFVGIKQDISERKQQEDSIQKLNAELEARVAERTMQLNHIKNRLESILNSNADPIVYSRLEGSIEQVNPAFTRAFGYHIDDIVLKPLSMLVIPDDVPKLDEARAKVVDERQAQQVDVTALVQDGHPFEASMMLSPVIEYPEHMVGLVLSIHDVTNRNHMLQEAMDLAELKSRYISMAAHDLRNPMAVVLTSLDTLQHYSDRLSSDKRQEKFDQIRMSIKNMTDILDDVLIMGQVDAGKLHFKPAPLDLPAFCQTLITESVQATGTAVRIHFSTEGISGTRVMDGKLLRHILANLLSNAIKYSPPDSDITFTVRGTSDAITFYIRDHGIGIPEAEQANLFETFYRASNAKHIRGTGLGLAIVKQSVELHGGMIQFESQEGRGTAFTVTLPTDS